ncbi:integrase domain-containing protein [Candidatus Fukatsuia endosymbiont of Tuberolachnus salignus]|uniref:integrase domain-containing protein n=1 Tax=Candidatus Fukatsuia endosymbiont of Tuberolachnus salignus TaxID=3077957 RepID=UPI00313E8A18
MAIQAKPLTNTEVKAAKATNKDLSLYDGGGLLLFVKSSGIKTWRLRYYHPTTNKRTTLTLGHYPTLSLAEARRVREEVRALLAQGIDPQEQQRQQQEKEKAFNNNTFAKITADWFTVKKSKGLTEDTLNNIWRSLEKNIFPYVEGVSITNLTAQTFIQAMEPIRASGRLETVRRVTLRINEVMNYAVNAGLIQANPAAKISQVFENPTVKHMPTIRPEKLPELMRTLSVANIELQTRLVIEFQLLTIARPAEAATARWDEINLADKTWTIPASRMKMRREHVIPLSPQSLAVLEAMKPISAHRPYVFPSFKNPLKPMNSTTANMALRRMGYKSILVAHGFRSIASTTLNEEGFAPDVIEAALAHVDTDKVRSAYNRSTYLEQRRVLMDWWGEFVEQAATGKFTAAEGVRGLRIK